MTVLAPPLDRISRQARLYPADLLPEGGTALALFAAAYLGWNDAIHFARKDMVGTCVDRDRERLAEMAMVYPADWVFFVGDAWEFAEQAADRGDQWDVVSVDTFTGDATDRSVRSLELWCELAREMLTATVPADLVCHGCPDGWRLSFFPRSTLASWLVLRRA